MIRNMMRNPVMGSSMRSAHGRRAAVLMIYIGYAVGVYCWLKGEALGVDWVMGAAVLAFVECAIGVLLLFRWSRYGLWGHMWRWKSEMPLRNWLHGDPQVMKDFDERELAVRDRAHVAAYSIYTTLTMLLFSVYDVALAQRNPPQLSFEQAQLILWGLIVTVLTLPAAILAWSD
ncbi:MAG TPA: hypothetical protein VHE37_13670, partial [Nevskiaceae bacterium]|nr:hypothetical protein [Nevskiaceae bacterium]